MPEYLQLRQIKCDPKNNLLLDRSKTTNSLPLQSLNVVWLGIQPSVRNLPKLINAEIEGSLRAKEAEFLLWSQYYPRDCLDFRNLKTQLIF